MAWMGMSIRPPGARAADFDAGACRARPPATFVFNSDREESSEWLNRHVSDVSRL
jgi:hypothetical protein